MIFDDISAVIDRYLVFLEATSSGKSSEKSCRWFNCLSSGTTNCDKKSTEPPAVLLKKYDFFTNDCLF